MEYSVEEIEAAFLADEVNRYVRMQHEHGPEYAALSVPDNTDMATLSADEVDQAVYELANLRGLDAADVAEQVLILSNGERDSDSRAAALVELAHMDEDEAPDLDDEADEDNAKDYVSDEKPKRRKRRPRRKGQGTASQGSSEGVAPFPGAGEGGEGPSGAGGVAATRRLVRLPTGELQTIALTNPLDPVEKIMAAHPELFVSLADTPSAFDGPGVTGHLGQHFDFDIYDVGARDDGDPTDEDGGRTKAILARLEREHPGEFGRQKVDALKPQTYKPRR